ncbi:MAG: hypothetical protein U1E63_17150 [Burkholderiales bacterium]
MVKMMNTDARPHASLANAYSVRYERLRTAIYEIATDTWESLDGAAIELVGGLFGLFDAANSNFPAVWNSHEAIRYLHDAGVIEQCSEFLSIATMRRHDVVFGLALHENEVANFLFGKHATEHGWGRDEANALGLRAAAAAAECLVWGAALKEASMRAQQTAFVEVGLSEREAPMYWVFRPFRDVLAEWRRPRTVWVTSGHEAMNIPRARVVEADSRQLVALANAMEFLAAKGVNMPYLHLH